MQNFVNSKKGTPLVVAHDAGAANHILAWMIAGDIDFEADRVCFQGPAAKAAEKLFPCLTSCELEQAFFHSEILISGTGWSSSLEYDARKIAKEKGIYSIAIIDHWTNYRSRFNRGCHEIMPDEIWVTDTYAMNKALSEFRATEIRLQKNRFLESQIDLLANYSSSSATEGFHRVLYVMEPIRDAWGRSKVPGERQAFEFFLNHYDCLGISRPIEIIIKPHPSDSEGKYDSWALELKDQNIRVNNDSELIELISWSQTVVGCQTYAMVVALAAGKNVVSSLPPHSTTCALPHKEIIHLANLVSVR